MRSIERTVSPTKSPTCAMKSACCIVCLVVCTHRQHFRLPRITILHPNERDVRIGNPIHNTFYGKVCGQSRAYSKFALFVRGFVAGTAKGITHFAEIRDSDRNIVEDETATILLKRLLDSSILQSCQNVFTAFDESVMFKESTAMITSLFNGTLRESFIMSPPFWTVYSVNNASCTERWQCLGTGQHSRFCF